MALRELSKNSIGMHRLPTAAQLQCEAFGLDGWDGHATEGAAFDLVVVGSGFCGYAVAERALRNCSHCRVLVLEMGSLFLPDHFQNLPAVFSRLLQSSYEFCPWRREQNAQTHRNHVNGVVAFLGGKSTLWSGWCPTPTPEELVEWPEEMQKALRANVGGARALMGVKPLNRLQATRPAVFGGLQEALQRAVGEAPTLVDGVYRVEAAEMATGQTSAQDSGFSKFAVPGELLKLASVYGRDENRNGPQRLRIATNCAVKRAICEHGQAIALETSHGVLPLRGANLVLAMGALPTTVFVANSFPALRPHVGQSLSAHFASTITARIPLESFRASSKRFGDLEMGACYVAGCANGNFSQQYHLQLTAVWNADPVRNEDDAMHHWPDVFGKATAYQMEQAKDHVVFVCVGLGEMDVDNSFRPDDQNPDLLSNSVLRIDQSERDLQTWDVMDSAAFEVLEKTLSSNALHVEYWHGSDTDGHFSGKRPSKDERRKKFLVHESSTLPVGEGEKALVNTDYRLRGTKNVYVTGGALFPRSGSWNPTLAMVALAQDLADKLHLKAK